MKKQTERAQLCQIWKIQCRIANSSHQGSRVKIRFIGTLKLKSTQILISDRSPVN